MTTPARSGATMKADPGAAVDPLVDERELELQGQALVGFGHDHGFVGEHGRESAGERPGQARGGTIWRVGEDEVVGSASRSQEPERVAAVNGRRDGPEPLEVAPDRRRGARVALDEVGALRPARERLDPER